MTEGGANEPTPIVHNGVIYLVNPGNIVQALDGRTGNLIWENRIGPELSTGLGGMRSLGIYQEKCSHHGCAPGRARRAHRKNRLGNHHRR